MSLYNHIKDFAANILEGRSIRKYQSGLGWRDAPKYATYLDYSRKRSPRAMSSKPDIKAAAEEFLEHGVVGFRSDQTVKVGQTIMASIQELEKTNSVWVGDETSRSLKFYNDQFMEFPDIGELFRGDIGDLLRSIYGCEFKIFSATLDKYRNIGEPANGSSLWHMDGGPGTCINMLFYPDGASKEQGAIEVLPWRLSEGLIIRARKHKRKVMRKSEYMALDRLSQREIICDFFKKGIGEKFSTLVQQPTSNDGTVVLFKNNCLHKGGHPDPGYERYASIFHCYPSHEAPDIDRYLLDGFRKPSTYLKDPAH